MPAKLLTRTEAAKALDMSVATLRRREGKQIHPVMSPLGEHLFRASDVERLARSGAAAPKSVVPQTPQSILKAARRALARLHLEEVLTSEGQPEKTDTRGAAKRKFHGERLASIRRAIDDGLTTDELCARFNLTRSDLFAVTEYPASAR